MCIRDRFYYFTMKNGDLTAYCTIKGLVKHTFKLKKPNVREFTFPTEKAFTGKNPINLKKIEDIKKVLKYVPEEHKFFFDIITSWPTTTAEGEDN